MNGPPPLLWSAIYGRALQPSTRFFAILLQLRVPSKMALKQARIAEDPSRSSPLNRL